MSCAGMASRRGHCFVCSLLFFYFPLLCSLLSFFPLLPSFPFPLFPLPIFPLLLPSFASPLSIPSLPSFHPLKVWDTAGEERFCGLGVTFMRGADAVIVAFAVDSRASFDALVIRDMNEVDVEAKGLTHVLKTHQTKSDIAFCSKVRCVSIKKSFDLCHILFHSTL